MLTDIFFNKLIQKNNESKKNSTIRRGSVLRFELRHLLILSYDHYAIYAGNKEVIHFSEKIIKKDPIEKIITECSLGSMGFFDVMCFPEKAIKEISLEQSYQRAISCIGKAGYDLLDNNCEHFALWCRTGSAFSSQAFGSKSQAFNTASIINVPRLISSFYNEIGIEKSRTISIEHLSS